MLDNINNIKYIYIYRVIGLLVSFSSIFVVVPFLASDPLAYAIYAFSMSLCFFLTYGDMGFLSAAQKYCAEEVGKNELNTELEHVGFVVALLGSIFIIFMFIMLYASSNPLILLPKIEDAYIELASKIFLIIAFFMPIQILLQRFVMLVLGARLKEYLAIRFDIIANVVKILIVPFFQTSSGFLLEFYFLISILLSITSALLAISTAAHLTNFPFKSIFKNIKFSSRSYNKMKGIAYGSLFSTIMFILYFEFDLIIAGRLYNLNDVAAYALAFLLMNFIRTISSIIYSPLIAYINQMWGRKETDNVSNSFKVLIYFTVPFFISTILVLLAASDILIFQWMGGETLLTINLFQILLIGSLYIGFINITPLIATTIESKKTLYLVGLIPFIVFYSMIFIFETFFENYGILGLAYAKALSGICAAIFSIYFLTKNSIINSIFILKTFLITVIGVFAMLLIDKYIFLPLQEVEQSLAGLMISIFLTSIIVMFMWFVFLSFFKESRLIILKATQIIYKLLGRA